MIHRIYHYRKQLDPVTFLFVYKQTINKRQHLVGTIFKLDVNINSTNNLPQKFSVSVKRPLTYCDGSEQYIAVQLSYIPDHKTECTGAFNTICAIDCTQTTSYISGLFIEQIYFLYRYTVFPVPPPSYI